MNIKIILGTALLLIIAAFFIGKQTAKPIVRIETHPPQHYEEGDGVNREWSISLPGDYDYNDLYAKAVMGKWSYSTTTSLYETYNDYKCISDEVFVFLLTTNVIVKDIIYCADTEPKPATPATTTATSTATSTQ